MDVGVSGAILPQALPEDGIRIFASQLHTHLAGRKVVTVLSRDGREQQVVNADGHYSPHFQVQPCSLRWVGATRGCNSDTFLLLPLRRSAC